jgi:hypothetical protein
MSILLPHPLSKTFPSMSTDEKEAFFADIQKYGQRQPIITWDGMILDGLHRYEACTFLGIQPKVEPLAEGVDPVAWVISANLQRRHLTASQRSAALVACADWAKSGRPEKGEAASPMTVPAMALAADVSERTIQQAKRAHAAGLGKAVRDGLVTAEQGAAIAKLPVDERTAAMEAPPATKARLKAKPNDGEGKTVKALHAEIAELTDAMDESDRQKQDLIKLVDSDDRLGSLLQEIAKLRAEKKVLQTRNDDLVRRVQELQTNLWAVKKRLAEMDQSGNDGEETSTDMDGNGWDGSEEVFSNEEVADGD